MSGLAAFLRKELAEVTRTWRLWVLPGILLFSALTGPITAKLTPALVQSVSSSQPGLVIQVPEPTYVDAYYQWVKNLTQLAAIGLVITAAGLVANERRSGTAVLVLTKPLSRQAFVVAKFLSETALLLVATAVSAVACWGVTLAVFGEASAGPLVESTALWLAVAVMLVALMVALSVAVGSQVGAAGVGIAAYLVLGVLSAWGPAREWSPAGVLASVSRVIDASAPPPTAADLGVPLAVTAVAVVVLLFAASALFSRQEL